MVRYTMGFHDEICSLQQYTSIEPFDNFTTIELLIDIIMIENKTPPTDPLQ